MYIREDLLYELKKFYRTNKFLYIKNAKDAYNVSILLFDTNTSNVAITPKEDYFYIFEVYLSKVKEIYYRKRVVYQKLSFDGENTILQNITYSDDDKTYIFPGKAFDFDLEIIVMKLEG